MSKSHLFRVAKRFRQYSLVAFSLVEMVVMVAIVLLLAALALPVFSKVQEVTLSMRCVANLRQIGIGCQGYVTENDGFLPGPIYNSVYAYYVIGNPALTTAIAPYVGLTKPTTYSPLFMCPAFLQKEPKRGNVYNPAYMIHYIATNYNGNTVYPFGSTASSPALQPMKLAQVSEIGGASEVWAICDLDKKNGPASAGWYSTLPAAPVHGSYRNALFFDWHVGRIDLDDNL